MLAAARKVLVTRPGLWVAAGICTLLAAIPQAAAVTVGAAGGVAFLLTGDATLAVEIWERTPGLSPTVLVLGAVALVVGFALWVRLYALAIFMSRPEEAASWAEAAAATRRTWRRALLLHLHAYAALVLGAVAIALAASLASPASFGTLILLGAGAYAFARTVLRIVLSIALRAVVLDGLPAPLAWRSAARFVRAKRHDVAVAWVGLVAIGVSVWIAGRLITPVLQETAFDYPATSGYEIARQIVQLLVSVPLETALFGFGIAVWTAVYDGVEARAERPQRTEPEPWVRKALAAAVVIALAGNGLTTVVDDAFQDARAAEEDRVAARDIKPEEVADASPPGPPTSPVRTSYEVEALLDGDELEWTTTIRYLNTTGERLADVGVNVFANAYTRAIPEIPFGRDLLTSDFNGEFQALARSGEMTRFELMVDDRDVPGELDDTGAVIDLVRELPPGERVEIDVSIAMELPRFPERFGRWDELTLLGNWIPVVAPREAGAWRLEEFGSIGDPFVSAVSDYDVTLVVDENVSVVGTGALVEVGDHPGGLREWRFEAPAVRDAAFVAGPFLRGLEAGAAGTTVRSWYPAGEGARGAANLEAATSSVADYVGRYGELPWPEVDVVETQGRLGGMEYPGVVFVSSASEAFAGLPLLPDLVAYSGFEEARSRYVVGHELAHQWWYASVGSDQIREPWLDEAFAEASTHLWLGDTDDGERTSLMTNLVADADASPEAVRATIHDFGSNETYTETVYLEGSEILMELRRTVGPDTYDAILREWHATRSLQIGTIDDFVRTVARVADGRADAFLERYF
jgi:hypothetical protein